MGLAIELAEEHPRLHAHAACARVDVDALHAREIDHEAAVAQRAPADVVAAAAHRDEEVVLAGEPHRGDHVRQPRAARDQPGMLVDAGVPDPPRLLVLGVAGANQPAAERVPE